MNNINNEQHDKGVAAVTLSIEHNSNASDALRGANQVSERFLCSGALLQDGEHLDFQIDVSRFTNVIYAGTKSKITVDDFAWIFSSCSKTFSETGSLKDLYEGNRKVYEISMTDVKDDNNDDGGFNALDDRRQSIIVMNELFNMLAEADAIIRITSYGVSGKGDGYGKVLLSTPDDISLRMRSIWSIIFPNTVVVEVSNKSDPDNGGLNLTDSCLFGVTRKLIYMLICRPETKTGTGAKDTGREDAERKDDHKADDIASVYDDFTPIEDLDLSVRAICCLKRAGIKTLGALKTQSADELMQVRNLGSKCVDEVIQKLSELQEYREKASRPKPDYQAMLDELVGLNEVKEQFKKIAAYAKMKHALPKEESDSLGIALNMAFIGNPGTAKTTVARIAAGLFHEIGLLNSDMIVEVGRSDLIGQYVGQTAIKVKDVFKKAKGKLLFIDEAYSLVDNQKGYFGDEAINTIVQEIENNRHDTIVIFAGYPKDMESFLESNPGLRSRVPFTIRFNDYSGEEMTRIVELEARKRGLSIDGKAIEKIRTICSGVEGNPAAGNGRFCRNLLECALLSYASRVYDGEYPPVGNKLLICEDFNTGACFNKTQKPKIGFCA